MNKPYFSYPVSVRQESDENLEDIEDSKWKSSKRNKAVTHITEVSINKDTDMTGKNIQKINSHHLNRFNSGAKLQVNRPKIYKLESKQLSTKDSTMNSFSEKEEDTSNKISSVTENNKCNKFPEDTSSGQTTRATQSYEESQLSGMCGKLLQKFKNEAVGSPITFSVNIKDVQAGSLEFNTERTKPTSPILIWPAMKLKTDRSHSKGRNVHFCKNIFVLEY